MKRLKACFFWRTAASWFATHQISLKSYKLFDGFHAGLTTLVPNAIINFKFESGAVVETSFRRLLVLGFVN